MKSWTKLFVGVISALCLAVVIFWIGWLWKIEYIKHEYSELLRKGDIRITQHFAHWNEEPIEFEVYIENLDNKLIEGEFVMKGNFKS